MVTVADDELRQFPFEVPLELLVQLDGATARRVQDFVSESALAAGGELRWHEDVYRRVVVVQGRAPVGVVSVVQALAMGHDVATVLDRYEDS